MKKVTIIIILLVIVSTQMFGQVGLKGHYIGKNGLGDKMKSTTLAGIKGTIGIFNLKNGVAVVVTFTPNDRVSDAAFERLCKGLNKWA